MPKREDYITMKKVINVGITGVNPFDGNRGVGALSYSISHILNCVSKKYNRNICIYLIINGSNMPDFCNLDINGELVDVKILPVVGIFSVKHILKMIVFWRKTLMYMKLDYVLDAGYGDSYSDIYGIGNFKAHNNTKRFFTLLGKKQLLLPQTIGPFFDNSVRKAANKAMSNMQCLLARDKMSFDYAKKNVPNVHAEEIIDMAFFMPYCKDILLNCDDSINVGIGISKMLWNQDLDKTMTYKGNYKELMLEILNKFLRYPNVKVHLVPHVVCDVNTPGNDYELCYNLYNEFKNPRLVLSPFFLDPIKAKNYISALDFFTGARMHACIGAFSSNVPVFPISYSRKFIGLFNQTLDFSYVGDLENMDNNSIIDSLFEAFKKRKELKISIETKNQTFVKEKYDCLEKSLTNFLEISK